MQLLSGDELPIRWRGRRALAFVPTLLAERDLELSQATVATTATAVADLAHAAASMPPDHLPLARLLLRTEGVASSFIEGVRAPVVDVVLAEELDAQGGTPAAWIAANLAAVTLALASADSRGLSVELLCAWHATLMTGSPVPARYVGSLRTEQGWIGGTSPLDAHLVTPPPEHLPRLLADLIDFCTLTTGDPVAQAAIAHAQFEVIHPFADGNGRIGRILIAWILTRRLSLITPPPVSTAIAGDIGGYSSGLTLFRMGQLDPWVQWFARGLSRSGAAQSAMVVEVEALQRRWREQLAAPRPGRALRSDSTAWRVLDLLPGQLLLTSRTVADELGTTPQSAVSALEHLAECGVLVEHASPSSGVRGRPRRLFVCPELLALTGSSPLR